MKKILLLVNFLGLIFSVEAKELLLLKKLEFEGHLTDIECADINNDKKPDILTVDFNGKLHIFYNQGKLNFIHKTIPTSEYPIGVKAADINNDGLLDVVVTGSKDCILNIFYQLKNGNLAKDYESMLTDGGPYGVSVGDLNQDKLVDVAVANIFGGNISLFYQKKVKDEVEVCSICGSRSISKIKTTCPRCNFIFEEYYCLDEKITIKENPQKLYIHALSEQKRYKAGVYPYGIDIGDLNGDGIPDIVVANYKWDGISIFFQENNSFDEKKRQDLYTGKMPTGVAIGKINGDDLADIAVANLGESNDVSVFFQREEKGSFTQVATLKTPGRNWNVVIKDLDNDGIGEVLVALENQYSVMVFKYVIDSYKKSGGEKANFELYATGGSGGSWGIKVVDIDLDGKHEILTSVSRGGINIFSLPD